MSKAATRQKPSELLLMTIKNTNLTLDMERGNDQKIGDFRPKRHDAGRHSERGSRQGKIGAERNNNGKIKARRIGLTMHVSVLSVTVHKQTAHRSLIGLFELPLYLRSRHRLFINHDYYPWVISADIRAAASPWAACLGV